MGEWVVGDLGGWLGWVARISCVHGLVVVGWDCMVACVCVCVCVCVCQRTLPA